MTRAPRLGLAALAVCAAWTAAGAQLSVVGVVRDSAGAPIVSAEVTILGRKALSDSLGRFILSHPAADVVDVRVRRMGYETVSFSVSAVDAATKALDIVMRRLATALATVAVEEKSPRAMTQLKGFDERREHGDGVFVTREEIEKRNTRRLTDVLRQKRGVIIGRGNTGLRFTRYQSKNCQPMIWLDGSPAPGLDLDAITATDVAGVELYQSLLSTPPEFHRGNAQRECGTIVIWTRRPSVEVKP